MNAHFASDLAPADSKAAATGPMRILVTGASGAVGSLLAPRAVTFLGMAREAARSMAAFARLRLRG